MKYRGVQGYIIAAGFLNMQKEDEEGLDDRCQLAYRMIGQLLRKYIEKNKINITKETTIAWNRFHNLSNGKKEIEILPFVCELVFRNPYNNKNKALTNLIREVQKEFLFSKDDIIKDTKQLVRDFYSK